MATSNEEDLVVSIRIIHTPEVAGPEIEALAAALKSVSPEVSVREEEPGPYGAWEWILPAAVMVYIGKGILDGFLKELGAGMAKSLKSALVNAFRKGKSAGSKWSTVEEMREYLKKIDAAAEVGQAASMIDRPGKPVVPLRISIDLPYGGGARFVLPVDLDENQVCQALDELKSVLPVAFARDQRRAELLTVQHTDPEEAMRLLFSDSGCSAIRFRKATYVYDPNKSNWVDADEGLQNDMRRQLEARARQNHPQTKSLVQARRPKRKRKK